MTGGARFWDDHEHRWGVVLEFTFDDEQARDAFADSPLLRAALDGAPDRVLVYPHRGGGDGMRQPRRPRPAAAQRRRGAAGPDPDADRICPCAPSGRGPRRGASPSAGQHPALDREGRAGDVAAGVADQEHQRRGQLLRVARPGRPAPAASASRCSPRGTGRSSPTRRSPAPGRSTRMPLRPVHCCARSRVRPISPALLAA